MTNAEARFNNSLRPRKPEGSLGWTAQDVHLDSHTAPELSFLSERVYFAFICWCMTECHVNRLVFAVFKVKVAWLE